MWQVQKLICFYTRLTMCHIPQSNWVASLERRTPKYGYVQGNVVWVVNEANTPYQWSRAFAEEIWGPLCEIALRRIDTQDSVRLHATSDVSASSQSDAILSDSKKWARHFDKYFSFPPISICSPLNVACPFASMR